MYNVCMNWQSTNRLFRMCVIIVVRSGILALTLISLQLIGVLFNLAMKRTFEWLDISDVGVNVMSQITLGYVFLIVCAGAVSSVMTITYLTYTDLRDIVHEIRSSQRE